MSVVAILTSKEGSPLYPLIGSWTVFNTKFSDVATYKSKTGFLPVIPLPPKDNVYNIIYTFLLDFKKDQNLNYNFCHNDQNIFHKLSHII